MQRVKAKKISEVILEQLESMILNGDFVAGQKLPSERELAERFDVSRPSLREAIQKLDAKGLVDRRQGGGTYVKDKLAIMENAPLLDLITAHPESQFDLLEFRHALEGMAAYYAALRGNKALTASIQHAFERVQTVQQQKDVEAEAEALATFYLQMIQASQNRVLLHIFRGLQPVLQDNIKRNLEMLKGSPKVGRQINAQRGKILEAIVAGDPEQARRASNEHLAYIEETLLEINRQDSRMQRTLRRIETPE
ncbi:Transcriptional regulator NanR [Saliniradius amylolyticus]|uniref:Pyruvate dehydrogenase complex repressor n=1 Tax=Saliniradius amylolyticus TaxID=2183582 RepID=A0A2S2E5J5_9ALTE|nr:pyruvate dehydrogenase complex transcriptional repressor PdhR [Saliniradius amylolyticus]AWL12903.1 Transcriptional regulator NanR [Saliniradius amylolyticus]